MALNYSSLISIMQNVQINIEKNRKIRQFSDIDLQNKP
jgi:hypothetical protein